MPRTGWHGLPRPVRAAVEARTGPVVAAHPIPHGLTCATAASLTTAQGTVFVKGVPLDHAEAREGQRWEAAINRYVRGVGPGLRWRVVAGGWELLGFEHIDGRHADLSPGSTDLPLVADALLAAQDLPSPRTVTVPRFEDRWARFLAAGTRELLRGEALLHTDTNPHNLMVTDRRAYLVDWATPALGPAWVDVAYTAVRLMEADCPRAEVLAWAARFPSWASARPEALAAFVAAHCRRWEATVGAAAARPSNARFAALLSLL
ncbi:phosphotransferase [Streptomyces sp. NPDC046215]|uniref:Aminoglycoside phosphotransferase domain-containing protein n=1 Tax=Streptomyces stramineus TaxID=173861 RepID=A0ABP3JD47_9ACTN